MARRRPRTATNLEVKKPSPVLSGPSADDEAQQTSESFAIPGFTYTRNRSPTFVGLAALPASLSGCTMLWRKNTRICLTWSDLCDMVLRLGVFWRRSTCCARGETTYIGAAGRRLTLLVGFLKRATLGNWKHPNYGISAHKTNVTQVDAARGR